MRTKLHSVAARVAEVAARQHGVISRSQLLALGANASLIKRWVVAGHLHPLYRGVYAVGHRNITQEGRWMAAVLASPEGSALSHGASGQLQGLIKRHVRGIAMHVSVPVGSTASPRGVIVHRPRHLEPVDVTKRLGIPTTTITRTVWDLASSLSSQGTRRAFEQAEKRDVFSRSRLSALLNASPSRKGAATIRQLLAEHPLPLAEVRSWLEELLLEICVDNGLPLPAVNVPLLGYEVDFLWDRERFVVEADGRDHEISRQRDRDNERDSLLGRAGYLVRRFSSRAMGRRSSVAAEVREILIERRR